MDADTHPDTDGAVPCGVVVLGMHRSGTSAATGLLSLLGLHPSKSDDLVMGTQTNAKGHWESRSMLRLNWTLLAETGHTWWFPPTAGELDQWMAGGPATSFDKGRKAFLRVHPREPWVWKDPRTCITLGYWRRALERPVAGVVVYRNPLDVARSLETRDGIPLATSLAVWIRYTRLLLEQAAGMPLLVSSYESILGNALGWSEEVRGFLMEQGMSVADPASERSIRRFVDARLQHSSQSRDDLVAASGGEETGRLFDALEAAVGAHSKFDPPEVGAEPAWVQDELDVVGPDWPSTWKKQWTAVPSLPSRIRSLVKRVVPLGR